MEKRMQYIEANLELIKTLLMGDKKTLTLEETCNYTGYTKSYMYKLTSGQQIPHMKRGKKVFFDKDDNMRVLYKSSAEGKFGLY